MDEDHRSGGSATSNLWENYARRPGNNSRPHVQVAIVKLSTKRRSNYPRACERDRQMAEVQVDQGQTTQPGVRVREGDNSYLYESGGY
jgi:hypothetical protein